MPAKYVPQDADRSIKANVDRDNLTYIVFDHTGKTLAEEGPFEDIDALIRHFQAFHPGVWLTTIPKPEEPTDA